MELSNLGMWFEPSDSVQVRRQSPIPSRTPFDRTVRNVSDHMLSSNGCSVEINLNNSFKDGAKFTTFPAGILDQHKSENVITCIKAHNINSFEVVFASATTDYQKKK